MPLNETVTIGEKTVTVSELTIREIYDTDMTPPESSDLIPLYLALDVDYSLVLAAVDLSPGELVALHPSDLDRITEAFRKANPFLAKPLVAQSRARQREILVSSYSELFVISLQQATAPESGITQ
jgi:hypothetical protein